MTPWEWEQWYKKHGVPESHRRAATAAAGAPPAGAGWWHRLKKLLGIAKKSQDSESG